MEGPSPAIECVRFRLRYTNVVKSLLEGGGVNPNTQDEEGYTALFNAAMCGHCEVVKTLIQHKGTAHLGQRPLTCAAQEGSEETVELLKGAEKLNGKTPNEEGDVVL